MTDDDPDLTSQELREEQAEKARDERRHADDATAEQDVVTHDRRSDKAAYLAAKLAERERSEQEAKKEENE
jgi:hypothetical protein